MKRAWVFNAILVGCLLLFEVFSYSSSKEALFGMTGMALWSSLIAFSLCAVDFAGLAKLLIPDESMPKDSFGMLFGAWLLSAVGDTFLTYLVVSSDMQSRASQVIMVSKGLISANTWAVTIPILVAVLVWLAQVMLVTGIERMIVSPHVGHGPKDGFRERDSKRQKKPPEFPI